MISDFRLFFITASPELASYVVRCGVDRLFVDLELDGKHERQGHLSTVISSHTLDDVIAVRRAVPHAELMVRLNPLSARTAVEVDQVIDAGADILMLPMFRTAEEVAEFTGYVSKRARVCLLVETAKAVENLADIIRKDGVDEVHIGLNDLHLDLGLKFMFEPLANGLVDEAAAILRAAEIPFGLGGVARCGEGLLPPELILTEHRRLGSSAAILSRTFHRNASTVAEVVAEMDMAAEIDKLRAAFAASASAGARELEEVHQEVQRQVFKIVADKLAATSALQ